jgi:hypothetical protein
MTAARCKRWAAVILLLLVATFGCNPLTMPFFLMGGMDPKYEPDFRLANDKHEVRVAILTYSPLEMRPELAGADREMTSLLAQHLQQECKANKELVHIVSNSKLQRFKDEHPNWKSLSPGEIGKYFDADYVIDLEIDALTLYEQGSNNQLFRGRAEISVSVVEVAKRDEEPIFRKCYSCEYPRTRGPVPVSDSNPQKFRLEFLTRVATDLSWLFTAHTVQDNFPCD